MSEDEPIDYEALRERFPWVGRGDMDDATDHASRYREIMAESLRNREIVEAIETILREYRAPGSDER